MAEQNSRRRTGISNRQTATQERKKKEAEARDGEGSMPASRKGPRCIRLRAE
jgi:hypothetical protein